MAQRSGILSGNAAISLHRWWLGATGAVRPPPDDLCLKDWRWPRFTWKWIAAFLVQQTAFSDAAPWRRPVFRLGIFENKESSE